MDENQKIIGNRVEIPARKGTFIVCIVMAVLGLVIGIGGLTGSAMSDGDMETAYIILGLGLFICVVGVLLAVMIKVQDKSNQSMKGTPTILLNADNTLTLYLLKNKTETVSLDNINSVKFKARVVGRSNGFYNTYTYMEDGTLVFKLKDGRSIKVPQVDKGAEVEKTINALIGKF